MWCLELLYPAFLPTNLGAVCRDGSAWGSAAQPVPALSGPDPPSAGGCDRASRTKGFARVFAGSWRAQLVSRAEKGLDKLEGSKPNPGTPRILRQDRGGGGEPALSCPSPNRRAGYSQAEHAASPQTA